MNAGEHERDAQDHTVSGAPRLAYVLSGGGSRGATQAGAIMAAVEAGFLPDIVVGASVGALNAAFLAWRPDHRRSLELAAFWASLRNRDLFPHRWRDQLANLVLYRDRLYSPRGLRDLFRFLPYRRIEDTAIPLVVVASDLDAGKARWFTEGPLEPALLASTAVPGVLPPVEIDGARYVDGAVTDPTSISAAAALGATQCLVFDLGAPTRCGRRGSSPLQVMLQAIHVIGRQRTAAELACPPPGVEVLHLPLPCNLEVPLADFSQSVRLVDEGYEQTRALLAAISASTDQLARGIAVRRAPARTSANAPSATAEASGTHP